MNRASVVLRIRLLSALCIVGALFLGVRLYFVQVVYGSSFQDQADRQYTHSDSNIFDRGSIYFQDKDGEPVAAATVRSGYVLAINPSTLESPDAAHEKLSKIISIDKEDFLERAAKTDDPYEEIVHRLSEDEAEEIDSLDITGVHLYREKWRSYPGESLASHVLGFVGYKGDDLVGRYGIEEYYENALRRDDSDLYINFFAEAFSQIENVVAPDDEDREADVYLTIEPVVQRALEEELKSVREKWDSRFTAGIIINPQTGRIYAMAVNPEFDPNNYSDVESVAVFTNPLVQSVYELGSIMKPITMAAGLDAGVVTPDTTYNDTGMIEVDGAKIYNYDKKGRGVVDMHEVLKQSLNTGVSFVVEELGIATFRKYLTDFGLREKTGIDLPGEAAPLTKNLDENRRVEHYTASFGQGIAISPMSMARALSALGNGGKMITPHVVSKVDYRVGLANDIEYGVSPGVISPETSEEISRMLVNVVDDALLGGTIAKEGYSIAAKTGTAQIADPTGGYYDDRYLHSFFGYFPAYDPEFLVFLMNVEPKNVQYASETLTMPFSRLTDFLINYYQVPPDR